MANHASRLAKLEQQANTAAVRFVWMNQGDTTEEAWQRYIAIETVDVDVATKARAAGRVTFLSWIDSRL